MRGFLWKIVIFVAVGVMGAFALRLGCLPWSLIWIVIPWLAIPVIFILALVVGLDRASWFKDATAHNNFKNSLWTRAVPVALAETDPAFPTSADRAIAYADRLVDRQINKVRGILPFNSIIMTILSLERYRLPTSILAGSQQWADLVRYWLPTSAFLFTLLMLGVSSFFCFELFRVRWNKDPGYAKFRNEFDRTIDLFNERGISITWAIVLSEASLFIGLCLVIMTEASVAGR
jgi:hypothetical protein